MKEMKENNMFTNKPLLLFCIVSIVICCLPKVSLAEKTLDFFDYFNSYKNKEFSFNVYFEDHMILDEIIMDYDASKRIPILAKTADDKNDVMALLKLECEKKICNVTGNFNFDFELVGLSNRIEPKFIIMAYNSSPTSDTQSITDTLKEILDVKLNLKREAIWADHTDFFWVVDKADKLIQQKINVYTEHFSKDEKVNLIKDCFNICKSVSVFGEPFFDELGWLSLKAIEIRNFQ